MGAHDNRYWQSFPLCPAREESDAMKGIFILLIVMAHNTLLVPTSSAFQNYFYQFHYFAFFILPLFYPRSPLTLKRTANYFIRFYVPYFWFFLATYLAYTVIWRNNGFDPGQFFSSFWGAEISQIKEVTGFHFLWFLPAFFAFSILRDVYSTSGKVIKWLLFLIALFVHFAGYLGFPSSAVLRTWIPLGIVQSFFLFPMGVITIFLLRYVPRFRLRTDHEMIHKIYAGCIALLVFSVLSIDFIDDRGLGAVTWSGETRNMSLSIFFFILVYIFREECSRLNLLRILGRYSMEIYLFHLFAYNALMYVIRRNEWSGSLLIGVVVMVLTLMFSMAIILIINRVSILRKILFPKELIC